MPACQCLQWVESGRSLFEGITLSVDRVGASSEYDLISQAVDFVMGHATSVEAETEDWLQTHADTPAVNRLRRMRAVRAITAVGSFSLFEALLQQKQGWATPWKEADSVLRQTGLSDVADRLEDIRDAINVLKHGRGRSYEALLLRRQRLAFRVKGPKESYFAEGDVGEGAQLIKVDDNFVRQCPEIIAEVLAALRRNRATRE